MLTRALARLQLWCMDVLWQSRIAGGLLSIVECLFCVLARWRKQWQLKRLVLVAVPVIVVGNISMGGTGKTPVTRALAHLLREAGYHPGILSRGYGGANTKLTRVHSAHDSAADIGDEAVMLARDFPVSVGRDRALTTQCLIEAGCDVLLSDDGLQHYRLTRDVEIVMVDARRGFGNGRCLPAGPLREPTDRLEDVDYILLRTARGVNARVQARTDTVLEALSDKVPVSMWQLEPCGFRNLASGRVHALRPLPFGAQANAVTAIANPGSFFEQLSALGVSASTRIFPDHYHYRASDLSFANQLPVIVTEKDAVKCSALSGLDLTRYWSLEVEAKLPATFKRMFLAQVKNALTPDKKYARARL